jgi:hypothetical protein
MYFDSHSLFIRKRWKKHFVIRGIAQNYWSVFRYRTAQLHVQVFEVALQKHSGETAMLHVGVKSAEIDGRFEEAFRVAVVVCVSRICDVNVHLLLDENLSTSYVEADDSFLTIRGV